MIYLSMNLQVWCVTEKLDVLFKEIWANERLSDK